MNQTSTLQIPSIEKNNNRSKTTRQTNTLLKAFFRDRQSLDSGLANQNANITIGTLNIQNIKGNSIYLQTILKSLDILCIQEHWILSLEKDIIKNINNDFISYVKSVDDDDPIIDHKAIRGYGGTAIFWNKDLEKSIIIMPDGKNRIQVITINSSPSKTCLVNVYMPSLQVAGDLEYKDTTDQISKIIEKYKDSYKTIICGDINASLHRDNRRGDQNLKGFMINNNLSLANRYPTAPTFFHHNGKNESAIRKLNTGKASDENGIVSEHYIHAIDVITDEITDIINQIFEELDVPQSLKNGILIPDLKKGKDKTIPGNYRGIVVTSIFSKIFETIIKDRLEPKLFPSQNTLQRRFTEGA
ncbi:unnamed protein product [Mytilus coruscus]|uniref:Endonuclease/exonuclease/phosphatase domain-containing protein n=1 Tax=Mytilus coruscus TaxID=42192 RepID=A0A6J8A2S3_MYTCO|nr:unnamed protein product [Mytilus coruscus]